VGARLCIPKRRVSHVALLDIPLTTLAGQPTTLGQVGADVLLIVNVASECGLTPQYEGLERLHERFADRGFAVVGFPCNQFGGQEPGSAEEIAEFCSANYGVTFPMMAKTEVNGPGRDAVYQELTQLADGEGKAGDVQWNFEKFLVTGGKPVRRIRPLIDPESSEVVEAIEAALG